MAGVCITTVLQQPASSVAALVLPTRRLLAPHVPSLPWRPRRRSAVDNVRKSPVELVRIVLLLRLTHLANFSVEQLVGIVEDPYWRSGGSVQHQLAAPPALPAVLEEQLRQRIIQEIMTTVMMKSGHWRPQRDT